MKHRGAIYDSPRPIFISVSMIGFWLAYELSEFARIHDNVEADIAQGFAAYLVGAFGTLLWDKHGRRWAHYWRNRFKPYYDD